MSLRFADPTPDHFDQGLLIGDILEGAVRAFADQEILYRDGRRYSYADLAERVHRLAGALAALDIGPGDTVAVLDWDSHRYLEAYFAVPMMGAVLQTANPRLSPEQLQHCLASTRAKVLLAHQDFVPLAQSVAPRLPDLGSIVLMADGDDGPSYLTEYEGLLSQFSAIYPFERFDENALATTFHTTGTTGLPKAVSFSHRQLVLHTLALAATLANQPDGQCFRRGDVYMPLTPMFHVHAWGMPYVATMTGVKQVYPGRYEPATILRLKREEGVTFSHCVPTVLQMLLDSATESGEPASFKPWTMVIGGSALPATLWERAYAAGIAAFAAYGMSETGPAISIARAQSGLDSETLCAAGMPLPLVRARIVGENDTPMVENGEATGELVLRAPWLTANYAGNPDASTELWRGGWLHTQDIASIAPNGTIRIRDRLKDVIKTGGEWVSSSQIEELLLEHGSVAEAAVIGVADPKWGERPYAFVVASKDAEPDFATLRSHLAVHVVRGRLNRIALIDGLSIVAALPRTSVGKIDKKVLRTLLPSSGVPA